MRINFIIVIISAFLEFTFVCMGIDNVELKDLLLVDLNGPESMLWKEYVQKGRIDEFKERFAITDKQLHSVLMELYNETDAKWASISPKTEEWYVNRRTVEGVIGWLPECSNIPVKDFLIDYAALKENDSYFRGLAVCSYLRVANTQETMDVLLRFLVGAEKMDSQTRSSIIEYARSTFISADAEKKAAILESLYVALSKEDTKWLFRVYDKLLCQLSKEYADSQQRLAILKRLIKAPPLCKADDILLPELQKKLKVLQETSPRFNINTNFAMHELGDISNPKPAQLTDNTVSYSADSQTDDSSNRDLKKHIIFLVVAFLSLVIGFGVWRIIKNNR